MPSCDDKREQHPLPVALVRAEQQHGFAARDFFAHHLGILERDAPRELLAA